MLDCSSLPAAGATTSHKSATPPGHADGTAEIEIFHSFHSLVDALAKEADASGARGKGHVAETETPADAGAKGDDDDASRVVPVDLAAMIAPQPVTPQDAGGEPHGTGTSDVHGQHVWTAADLAALLRGGRGAAPQGANGPADDQVPDGVDDVVDRSGGEKILLPESSRDALLAEQASIDAKASQAIAQRLLAASAGPRQMIEELAGHAAAGSKNTLDEFIRQSLLNPERTPGAGNPASRLVASLTPGAPGAATAIAAGSVGAPAATEPLVSETTDQIIQAIRLQVTRGGGEAQIRLEPRQFGDMTVSVHVNQGQVVARLSADTAVVREWLQANEHLLRQSLAEQHLTLTRLEVSEPSGETRQRGPRDGNGQPESEERPARRPRTHDTGETFDVVA